MVEARASDAEDACHQGHSPGEPSVLSERPKNPTHLENIVEQAPDRVIRLSP